MSLKLPLTIKVFFEGTSSDAPWVSYNPEFKVASCGSTSKKAEANLKDAIQGFLDTCKDLGTLKEVMHEAGFILEDRKIKLDNIKAKVENIRVVIPALSA